MKRLSAVALVSIAACGGATNEPASVRQQVPDDEPVTERPVRVHLLGDVTHVAPGQEFSLGVRFDILPSWHIYWLNAGDAGLPTDVRFSAPPGFQVGSTRFPGPTRFVAPGNIVSFVYEDVAMISAPVIAPDTVVPGDPVTFGVAASWLMCREECVRGSANTQLTLRVADADTPSRPTHTSFWEAHQRALPTAFAELEGSNHEFRPAGTELSLVLTVPGDSRAEYFPSSDEQKLIRGQATVPGEGTTQLHVTYGRPEHGSTPRAAAGVIRVENPDGPRYYQLELPWPPQS